MEEIFLTKSARQTQNIATNLAKNLNNGSVILLKGNLGAGKTTFVQGFAKGLGIKRRIISPTFIITRMYQISNIQSFYHIDLYRVQSEKEVEDLGMEDIVQNPKNIIAIEWPEKLGPFLSKKTIEVNFEKIGERERKIIIRY